MNEGPRDRQATTMTLPAALIGVPPLRHVFDLEPVEPKYWPVLALFLPLFLLAEEARKVAVRAGAAANV